MILQNRCISVFLDEDVAQVFTNDDMVNRGLRLLLQLDRDNVINLNELMTDF